MQFSDAIRWRHNKFKTADGRHIENRFLAISRRHIGRLMRNLEWRWRIICRYRSCNQKAIFANSRWRTAAILKIALYQYVNRQLSDFDHIWYANADFNSQDWYLTKKNRNFVNSRWRTDTILKIVFGYRRHIGRLMRNWDQRWRITCRYRSRDQNSNFRHFNMAATAMLKVVFQCLGIPVILVMN